VTVGPLQQYENAQTVSLGPPAPSDLLEHAIIAGLDTGLRKEGQETGAGGGFALKVKILTATAGAAGSGTGGLLGGAATTLGFSGLTSEQSGQLAFEVRLYLGASEDEVGYVRWEGAGDPAKIATRAGEEAGAALAKQMDVRKHERFERRVADERFFLVPTAQTLPPGSLFLSNDELLLFRAGVGLHRRVQLDVLLGGFAVPFAGGIAIPAIHIVGAAGGVGLGVIAVADVGLKFRILDEGRYVPGLSLSYDMLNVFGGVFGAGALAIGGRGGGLIQAAGGAATGNIQFNVFTVALAKHFGPVQVVLGSYIIDNHAWIGQSTRVSVVTGGSSGSGGAVTTMPVDRVPTQVQPFAAVEWVLGPHSALVGELLPRIPADETMITTGARWQLGWTEPSGPIATDRIGFRLDLAGIWVWAPKTSSGKGGFPLPLPWLGLGIYVR
jgi:hypothetical protein